MLLALAAGFGKDWRCGPFPFLDTKKAVRNGPRALTCSTVSHYLIADAEITEIASEAKLSAKTSDLSVGGCFLDMLNPSPEGTEIEVRISHANSTFTGRGRVVFFFPNMGMGVMFTSVEASQQAILQKWLAELSAGEG
jgi:hypothetical protein